MSQGMCTNRHSCRRQLLQFSSREQAKMPLRLGVGRQVERERLLDLEIRICMVEDTFASFGVDLRQPLHRAPPLGPALFAFTQSPADLDAFKAELKIPHSRAQEQELQIFVPEHGALVAD